jgi:hypothetical protein
VLVQLPLGFQPILLVASMFTAAHLKSLVRAPCDQVLIPSDLNRLAPEVALKVPLAQLREGKEKVRSALNRATRKDGRNVATASDVKFLYIWNETPHDRRDR